MLDHIGPYYQTNMLISDKGARLREILMLNMTLKIKLIIPHKILINVRAEVRTGNYASALRRYVSEHFPQ